MTTLVEALTEQFQFWLGESASISPLDVAKMLAAAQTETTNEVAQVKIRIEGDPKDVALATVTIKQVLKTSEVKAGQPQLTDGLFQRELNVQGRNQETHTGSYGHRSESAAKMPKRKPATSELLLRQAVATLACGLLEFPMRDDGSRKFDGAYPKTFKDGMGKLSAYFISKGVIIADALDYWRILSRPLKDWPSIPSDMAAEESLIDHEGKTTSLTQRLAQKAPYRQ